MSSSVCLIRRCMSAVLLAAHVGCTSWRAQAGPPTQVLAERQFTIVRAHLADSDAVVLANPRIEGDALVGRAVGRDVEGGERETARAIPLDSVIRVDTKGVQAVKTVALTAGVLVGVAGVAVAALFIHCSATNCIY